MSVPTPSALSHASRRRFARRLSGPKAALRGALAFAGVAGMALIPMSLAPVSLVASAHAAPPAPAADAPLKLTALTITGNSQVSTADINAAVPFHVGDTVTQNQISVGLQDVIAVYKSKNVGASFGQKLKFVGNKSVSIEWQIGEQAAAAPATLVVDSVAFSGNKKVTSAELAAATKLRPGSAVTNEAVIADQQAIQGVYKAKNVTAGIGMTPTYPSPNHAIITWTITEKSDD